MEASETLLCFEPRFAPSGCILAQRRKRWAAIGAALIFISVSSVPADEFSFPSQAAGFQPGRDFPAGPAPTGPPQAGAIEPGWAAPGLIGPSGMDEALGANGAGPAIVAPVGADPAQPAAGDDDWTLHWFPLGLLWHPPLANLREPRCYVTLGSLDGQHVIDTSIGATFGLLRFGPVDCPEEGIQLDVFGDAFTRFEFHNALTAADYRAGVPLTFAAGGWQVKLSYEYTGCHLGDEYMLLGWNYGIPIAKGLPTAVSRNEAVCGVARVFYDCARLYGQIGYSFTPNDNLAGKPWTRYDWGIEYSPWPHVPDPGRAVRGLRHGSPRGDRLHAGGYAPSGVAMEEPREAPLVGAAGVSVLQRSISLRPVLRPTRGLVRVHGDLRMVIDLTVRKTREPGRLCFSITRSAAVMLRHNLRRLCILLAALCLTIAASPGALKRRFRRCPPGCREPRHRPPALAPIPSSGSMPAARACGPTWATESPSSCFRRASSGNRPWPTSASRGAS